jgi:CubicO group peptidase (beta-lactamase class C family)
MPFHSISQSSDPRLWKTGNEIMPTRVSWNGDYITFDQYLAKTQTNAFLVVRDGLLTYEWYKKSISAKTILPSYSVAKTLTSIMIGQLVAEGKIEENQTFVEFFPQYKTGDNFDKITIKHLLDMQSGLAVSDQYPSKFPEFANGISQLYATRDLNYFIVHHRKMKWEPGDVTEYASSDTQLLGLIIKKISGGSVADYFEKNVWQRIGAGGDATWNVDYLGGIEKTFCCFNAIARDFALIGQLLLDNGINTITGAQIIPRVWLERLSKPTSEATLHWAYGAQIWHPYPDTYMMAGLHGQFIYIQPKDHVVIVKLSDEPTINQDPALYTVPVLREIAGNGD